MNNNQNNFQGNQGNQDNFRGQQTYANQQQQLGPAYSPQQGQQGGVTYTDLQNVGVIQISPKKALGLNLTKMEGARTASHNRTYIQVWEMYLSKDNSWQRCKKEMQFDDGNIKHAINFKIELHDVGAFANTLNETLNSLQKVMQTQLNQAPQPF